VRVRLKPDTTYRIGTGAVVMASTFTGARMKSRSVRFQADRVPNLVVFAFRRTAYQTS
jgi:hypothetical protein